jgi:putative phosphoesterase
MPPETPSSTRILLLSDTHGQLHPEILALARRADHVVHAGDIGHPDILAQLAGDGRHVTAVRGNNDMPDKWPAPANRQLARLEGTAQLEIPGGIIAIEHGDGIKPANRRHDLLRSRYPQARLVLYGHSHRQVIDKAAHPWVVNPGAAGRSRTFGGSGCVLLTAGRQRWHLVPFQFALASWKK